MLFNPGGFWATSLRLPLTWTDTQWPSPCGHYHSSAVVQCTFLKFFAGHWMGMRHTTWVRYSLCLQETQTLLERQTEKNSFFYRAKKRNSGCYRSTKGEHLTSVASFTNYHYLKVHFLLYFNCVLSHPSVQQFMNSSRAGAVHVCVSAPGTQ